jgi:hypothetical protein
MCRLNAIGLFAGGAGPWLQEAPADRPARCVGAAIAPRRMPVKDPHPRGPAASVGEQAPDALWPQQPPARGCGTLELSSATAQFLRK